ncbi:hypothetical protein LG275_03715 [Chryseomicrobium palamuruense]
MSLLRQILNKDTVLLGNKRVEVKKITPAVWKQLFTSLDQLPLLILTVFQAPKDKQSAYFLEAINLALDEVLEITHVITRIDKDYLEKEVGIDELAEYFVMTFKKNRLDTIPKNLKSLLQK